MEQRRIHPSRDYRELDGWLRETGAERLFLVCGSSLRTWRLGGYFDALEERLGIQVVRFSGFRPNPRYEEAEAAEAAFRAAGCQALAAVGGGSALDVAKCVKLWAERDPIPFLAVPTTAGTGSEATRYAVVYRRGEKQSIAHERCLPSAVMLDPAARREDFAILRTSVNPDRLKNHPLPLEEETVDRLYHQILSEEAAQ